MGDTVYVEFMGPVDAQSMGALQSVVTQAFNEGLRKFVLLISTPGGSVFHGLSAYNFLVGLPIEIETHNFGSVDSIGCTLFCAGKRRYSVPDARFLLHPVTMNFEGRLSFEEGQLHEHLESLKVDTMNIARILAKETGKNAEDIHQVMNQRTALFPPAAKEFGLVHEIRRPLVPPDAKIVTLHF